MTFRPNEYTPELAAKICELMAEGKSLREISRDENMPYKRMVLKWRKERPEFADQYARAREARVEHWAEEITDIADDGSNDYMETAFGPRVNSENIQRSKLRVDTRRWLMSKLDSKTYGDKLAHTGADGGPMSLEMLVLRSLERDKADSEK